MIAILDYQMGNVGSIVNMLKRLGASAVCSADPSVLLQAEKLILPGVGSFDAGMKHLRELGLLEVLEEKVLKGSAPILGICLGMQLLTRRSEEGSLPGLGWIQADTVRFRFDSSTRDLKIPHMGWNQVSPRSTDTLFKGMDPEAGFYFVHSYHVVCDREEDVLATATHGFEFTCALARGHVFGTQFHPEKSHRHGMALLQSFLELPSPC